jgi:hypothetical protein
MPEWDTKICTKCGKEKLLSDFHRAKRASDGRRPDCGICGNKANHQRRFARIDLARERDKKRLPQRKNYRLRNLPIHLWMDAKKRARLRNLEFSISVNDIVIPAACPVFGTSLTAGTNTRKDDSPTLDRIDNKIGYVPDNIAIISWRANRLKSDGSIADFERLVAWLRFLKNPA